MHGQVYVQLCSDTPLRGTVPSMVIRGTRCKRVPPTLRTETRIKRVICLVFEGKGKTFVQLEKGKNSRYWINICSAHGRTPLSLCLLSSMILNIFLIFNLFIYSFLLLYRLFLFMALRNCKYKEFFINSLDEKILMRVFFKRILHWEKLIDSEWFLFSTWWRITFESKILVRVLLSNVFASLKWFSWKYPIEQLKYIT